MPKQTFFNLPAKKKEILLTAAKKEFSRVPLYEASIANIIKDADIARGSFYQYFEDKEDLYYYLLQCNAIGNFEGFVETLKINDGDFFIALEKTFQNMLEEIEDETVQRFYQNVFLNMDYKTEKTFLHSKKDADHHFFEVIKKRINRADLNIENDDELFQMVQICFTMMLQNIISKFAMKQSNEVVMESYLMQLHLMKKGFLN